MKSKWFINLFLGFTKITGFIPAWILMKPKVYLEEGAKRSLPKNCILISNHKSLLDFVLYLIVFPFSTIHFLMAEVLYRKGKFFSFLLNSWGGIKVERDDRDFSFVSESVEVLEAGGRVGIFPESRLPINGKPFPFTPSAAFIALNSSAPIVPVYTDGKYALSKRTSVCIGKPFYASDFIKEGSDEQEQIQHLTKVIEDKVYDLKDQMKAKAQLHPLFSFRHFFMDMARLVSAVLVPILRIKRLTPDGKKYKGRIKGGAIIAANHTSYLDPFIAGVTFWYRRMHFLAAEVVMKTKLREVLLRGVGAIKIDRNGTDIEAITKSVSKLKSGFLLTVFPEGGIQRNGDDDKSIKSGTALISLKSSTPVVPVHIFPRKHWYNTRTVVIGAVIDPGDYCQKKFPSTADIEKLTEAIAEEMKRCREFNQEN